MTFDKRHYIRQHSATGTVRDILFHNSLVPKVSSVVFLHRRAISRYCLCIRFNTTSFTVVMQLKYHHDPVLCQQFTIEITCRRGYTTLTHFTVVSRPIKQGSNAANNTFYGNDRHRLDVYKTLMQRSTHPRGHVPYPRF